MSEQPYVTHFEMDGKKYPMLNIPTGYEDKVFRFGVSKADLVLKYRETIETFVDKYGKKTQRPTASSTTPEYPEEGTREPI